ncbi:hypothetical protein ONS96_008684 [Cadophora gregata f. sp. sojae]|nr:hypothetical protein ONS96_008684 [Cadophora gregata f. sp. sojae]
MSTPVHNFQDVRTPANIPAGEQNSVAENGREPNEYDPFKPETENFQDALGAIADDQPLRANARVQETVAKLNPVPAIQQQSSVITEHFTADSHDLARGSEIEGALQSHDGQINGMVRDIGWHKTNNEIPDPLIGGLLNGQLFAMIRRFNKDVFSVEAVSPYVARGLDLNDAWSDEYASDKITLHLQRLYLSIVLGLASFGKQVSRLRSWKETQRTSAFCSVYFVAWLLDLLMPLCLGTLMLVVSSETCRDILFPPAPRALVNMNTGGLQNPASGKLGTDDSLTGAPEKQQGEAIEEEAANFVKNVRHMVQKAVGMHEKDQNEGDPLEGKVPKPVRKAVKAVKAEGTSDGHATEEDDQTQKPMEDVLWKKANPENLADMMEVAPHVVGEIVDNWERFANALSPTPPFSKLSYLRIDAVLLPLFLGSLFLSSYMVYKGTGFAIGLGIFGDPLLTPALKWLNHNVPNWVELLEPKNNILRGVPTNSQLTLALLRIGEVHNTPIPPVPTSNPEDADQHQAIDLEDIPVGSSPSAKVSAIQESPSTQAQHEEKKPQPKHNKLSKISRIFKGNTKTAVESKLAIDHVRAKVGSDKAKGHLGVLPKPKNLIYAGPSHFKARLDGKQGWLYITEGTQPILLYTMKDPRPNSKDSGESLEPVVQIDVEAIKKLKRATAFVGKPAEMAAGWSSDKELLGSVEVEDGDGKMWRFTALPERDELFNRLIAVGGQRWENK